MENAGEHIVGQYLQLIKKCDFVQYNLQTKTVQGEIDVVGINSEKREVYVCEVATHLETGLQYTKDNNCNYMLWTPIVKIPKKDNTINNQERDIQEVVDYLKNQKGIELKVIYNKSFLDCIEELRKIALDTTQEIKSPIMRFLQIEEKIKKLIS